MGYNAYFKPMDKIEYFDFWNRHNPTGTKFIFTGKCYVDGKEIELNNALCEFMHIDFKFIAYFKHNNAICSCTERDFKWGIRKLISEPKIPVVMQKEPEFYWTDDMVTKTIWYVIIMLVAVIFKECIGIWIFATLIWYNSTFKKKKNK